MRSPSLVKRLDFTKAAQDTVARRLDHFPELITDACLVDASNVLEKHALAQFRGGRPPVHETITMPRKGFGPRPALIMAPETRTLYTALVDGLSDSLPSPSRGAGQWDVHHGFGLEGNHEYVVELDVASCYEYINHRVLGDELLLRSMDVELVDALEELLKGLFPRGYGIPQMLPASDRLADAYLSIMDRKLSRTGHELHRFADDFRVLADDWEVANRVIEEAAECAREIGLVLSSEKTRVFKRETLAEAAAADRRPFTDLVAEAWGRAPRLSDFLVLGPYEEMDVDDSEADPDEFEIARGASRRVLSDWTPRAERRDQQPPGLRRLLTFSLVVLIDDDERIAADTLADLVFDDPQRLEQVCRYLKYRGEDSRFRRERHWSALWALTSMGRQSPWAKLWLLDVIGSLPMTREAKRAKVLAWVREHLGDRHEVVRASAAWVLAGLGEIDAQSLGALFAESSTLSRPALAAAAARMGSLSSGMAEAFRGESPLTKEAWAWASS